MPELGYQTLQLATWSGLAADSSETNPDLMWPKSNVVFDKMRREDPQVGSVLRAVMLPIRSAAYSIDPAGCRPEVVEAVAADFGLPVKGQDPVSPPRTKDRFSWGEHLRLALLELVFGHAYFEQVYRVESVSPEEAARLGLAGTEIARLRKLAYRPPRTIARFDVARDGGLQGIAQTDVASDDIVIPVDRLVAYVNEREGGDWVGQSLLRQAYKMWLLKDRVLRAQALTIERNGLGVPVYEGAEIPENATPEERDAWIQSELESGLEIAKGFRAGETAGASLTPGAKLTLQGVTGQLPDTDKPIRYYDEQIARAVLAHFLNLGTETGSWALGSTFADFFTGSLNAVAQQICDVTNQHVVEDLVDANWGPEEPAPRLVFEPIGSEHPATAEAIKALIDAGALTADKKLEAHLRGKYGLPAADEETAREPRQAAPAGLASLLAAAIAEMNRTPEEGTA